MCDFLPVAVVEGVEQLLEDMLNIGFGETVSGKAIEEVSTFADAS